MQKMARKIAVITTSRADYGHLYWPLHDLARHPDVDLKLIVLGSHLSPEFGLTAQEIAAAVERILQVEVLVVENEQEVFAATVALKQGQGAFADALIAGLGARAGCTHTLTFDKKALRLPAFRRP